MTSPAERYAAAKKRAHVESTLFGRFRKSYDFELDDFQADSCIALEQGRAVLVAAPTGAGKTIVGEFAAFLAVEHGMKCFYTTPIKALSNQKYAEFVETYGSQNVGLLTGDISINGEAAIVVMTTEVLRNMIYAGSNTLDELEYVVLDEVHYLGDKFRGPVWEEVIIHLPEQVTVVSLSATVSNAEEFGEWIESVRGRNETIVSETRPVPLWQHVMVGSTLYDLFEEDGEVSRELVRAGRNAERGSAKGFRRAYTPSRSEVVELLEAEGLLPGITFIFSRAGCEAAVRQILNSGIKLTTQEERARIRNVIQNRCSGLPPEDLGILGFLEWQDALERGVAAHHAGLIPIFKETVEELFQQGLIKVVFATETLALGINMPAKSVVLERLVKWNGEGHVDISPGEFTQLTGRAGRRGIDIEGHAVVLWADGQDGKSIAGLASTRTYPLRSAFQPTYNMSINLIERLGKDRARNSLETSFAQFQADKSVVGIARNIQRHEEGIRGFERSMECHLGNFSEYADLRSAIKRREQELTKRGSQARRAEVARSLETLKRGDVIVITGGRRAGLGIVLDPGVGVGFDGLRPSILTIDKHVARLSVQDFRDPVEVVARVKIASHFDARSSRGRKELAKELHGLQLEKQNKDRPSAEDDGELLHLRHEMRKHPCHNCEDREDHARWGERRNKALREIASLREQVSSRTNVIARKFDRICRVLDELEYLSDGSVTDKGLALRKIYSDFDLLTVICLENAIWDGLEPAELAAIASLFTYEGRGEDRLSPKMPSGRVRDVVVAVVREWSKLADIEARHSLPHAREIDAGFAQPIYRWALGNSLESVLKDCDISAGDFVRNTNQLIDFLGQIASLDLPISATARDAVGRLRRGVVANLGAL